MELKRHVLSRIDIKDCRALQLMMFGASTIAVSNEHRPIHPTTLRSPTAFRNPLNTT